MGSGDHTQVTKVSEALLFWFEFFFFLIPAATAISLLERSFTNFGLLGPQKKSYSEPINKGKSSHALVSLSKILLL